MLANNLQYLNILDEPETNVLTQTETLTKFLVDQPKQVFGKTINFQPNAKTNIRTFQNGLMTIVTKPNKNSKMQEINSINTNQIKTGLSIPNQGQNTIGRVRKLNCVLK